MKATTKPVWILVADSSTARLFTAEHSASDLIEIETLTHAEAHLHEQDLVTDSPGRGSSSGGAGNHAYTPEVSAKEQEEMHFAKRVIKHLSNELNHNKFERLFIVAAPAFLGSLRSAFNNRIEKQVSFSLGKNIVNLSPVEIRGHLPHSLA
ncbi:MAG: host attachment protein [Thiotrichales bacterium]|nr:host attachment protein [Thiotrichales bacterium]